MSKTSISIVSKVRGATTGERLRSDHIMTLELFQATMDENGQLKEELRRLKRTLRCQGDGTDEAEEEEEAPPQIVVDADKSNAVMVQKILKQDKELAELRLETKQLKIKRTQDELRLRDLQRSNNSNEALRLELEAFKNSSSETDKQSDKDRELLLQLQERHQEHVIQADAEQSSLRGRIQQLEEAAKGGEEQREKHQEQMLLLEEQVSALQTQLADVGEKCELADADKRKWEAKYEALRRAADEAERALQDQVREYVGVMLYV